jgi:hypothetical protein
MTEKLKIDRLLRPDSVRFLFFCTISVARHPQSGDALFNDNKKSPRLP